MSNSSSSSSSSYSSSSSGGSDGSGGGGVQMPVPDVILFCSVPQIPFYKYENAYAPDLPIQFC